MNTLVNAALGAIGNRQDVNRDWQAVDFLFQNWQNVFGPPNTVEAALGDTSGLPWVTYAFAVFQLAARRAGPGGNWANPQILAFARNSILAFAQSSPPPPQAPAGQCGPVIARAAVSLAAVQAPQASGRAPRVGQNRGFVKTGTKRRPLRRKAVRKSKG